MNEPRVAFTLRSVVALALMLAADVHATDNCGDIDVDRGPALRVIVEECRAQRVDSSTCSRIAENAVRRLVAM